MGFWGLGFRVRHAVRPWAGYGLATVGPLFEYLRLLRGAGPQRWVFDELAAIAALRFRFAEDENACGLVARLAADMPLYAPPHALRGAHIYEQWRPDLVRPLHVINPWSSRAAACILCTRMLLMIVFTSLVGRCMSASNMSTRLKACSK